MSVRFEDLKVGDFVLYKSAKRKIVFLDFQWHAKCSGAQNAETVLIQVSKQDPYGWSDYEGISNSLKLSGLTLDIENWKHFWLKPINVEQHFPQDLVDNPKRINHAPLSCLHCQEFNPWAESNLKEHKFLCYSCRSTPTTMMRYENLLLSRS